MQPVNVWTRFFNGGRELIRIRKTSGPVAETVKGPEGAWKLTGYDVLTDPAYAPRFTSKA